MKINFTNVNFEKDINLPKNIQTLNRDIKKICNELPALNIVKDVNLLEYTIKQTEKFKINKKKFCCFWDWRFKSRSTCFNKYPNRTAKKYFIF